jgi:hypothetical protein
MPTNRIPKKTQNMTVNVDRRFIRALDKLVRKSKGLNRSQWIRMLLTDAVEKGVVFTSNVPMTRDGKEHLPFFGDSQTPRMRRLDDPPSGGKSQAG